MALRPLNSIEGFSVGETLIDVISPDGNVTTSKLVVTGNSVLGPVSNVRITGGTSGYVLSTDGTGNLSWVAQTGGGGGNGTPGGANTQIQFNDDGNFAGNVGLTFNKTTSTLTANNFVASTTANLGDISNVTILGGNVGQALITDGAGNLSWATISSSTSPTSPVTVTVDDFTGDGIQTEFTLSTTPGDISLTTVNYDGVILLRDAYAIVGDTIIFSEPPAAGSLIEVSILYNGSELVNGTSNVAVSQNGNITLSVGGIANVLTITTAGANVDGTLNATGNITAPYFIGNGSLLTGIDATSIQNGNSNVKTYANGNVTTSVAGNANIVVVTGIGANINGTFSVSGNATTGNFTTAGIVSATGGATFAGNVTMTSKNIVSLANPVNPQDAATKSYVDEVAQGLSAKAAAKYATAVSLPAYTYNNGTSGVGATLTGTANGSLVIDGHVVLATQRILVKNETGANAPYNGIYVVTTPGNVSTPYVLTRATDMDAWADVPSAYVFVQSGNTNADTGWVCVSDEVGTIGTTDIDWTQFSGAGSYIAGTGLTLTGTVFSVNVAQPQITSVGTLTSLSVSGNVRVGNLSTTGNISANYFIGNGSLLTGIDATSIQNGNSNVKVYANGNVTTSVNGTSNVLVITDTSADVAGNISATGNIAATYFIGNGSLLTGIDATSIQNGTSNVKVYNNGNVTTSANGVSNVTVISDTGATVNGSLSVTGNVDLFGANVTLGSISNLHIAGGTADYALKTDGAGNLSWGSVGTALVMTTDAFVADGSNASFTLTAAPLNKFYTIVSLGGLFQPASTYSLVGNVVTFSSVPPATAPIEVITFGGGTAPIATTVTYAEITANTNAELNTKYIVNTDTTAITVTLPNNPILGSEIGIIDGTGNASVHNITIAGNGNKIQGSATNMTVSTNRAAFTLVYYNASQGWLLTNV